MSDELFRRMWAADWPRRVITDYLGTDDNVISYRARRMGLGHRLRKKTDTVGHFFDKSKMPIADHVSLLCQGKWSLDMEKPKTPVPQPAFTPPGWDIRNDGKVFATKGKYAEIAALSSKLGISGDRILARYHQLRAG